MENKDQPAYPPNAGWEHSETKGLTKREYLAGLAMQGLITESSQLEPSQIAIMSCEYADALLNQLNQPHQK